jgi:hypothetical protein
MFTFDFEEPTVTAVDARARLRRLVVERAVAADSALGTDETYMDDLSTDIQRSRVAFVGLAVTEIATLRAEITAPLRG